MKPGCRYFALLAALMLLVSCKKEAATKSSRPETAPPRAVRVARVEMRAMERALPVVGTLSARDEATVAAQVSGQVEKQLVDFGDRVTTGQELTRIDTTSYDALVNQANANLSRATAAVANAERNLKRIEDLQKEQVASTSELDAATAQAGQARADVKSAEANARIAQLNLERSVVKAPFDGAVAQRIANVGDYLDVGEPIFRLVKINPLRLKLEVPERESMAARLDQTVRVTVEGATNVYTGKISRVAPAIREGDRMLQVEADIPNPGELRAGLFARAQIVVNENEQGISVPTNALVVFAGIEKVVTVKDGKATERTVATGRRAGNWIEIISGVNANETVALDPTGLRTGQAVTIENSGTQTVAGDTNSGGAR